jgi:phosphonoacetaldehyde hydrolase
MAPVTVFVEVFRKNGINITLEEARKPMGLAKRSHIEALMQEERICSLWKEKTGNPPSSQDVDFLYAQLEPQLAEVVKNHSDIIPGTLELQAYCRTNNIRFGSTTGYVGSMMTGILPLVEKSGFRPDCIVASDEVPCGRPAPFMIFENMKRLNLYPASRMVKLGDTVADIQEGLNAGMWTVGFTLSGNEAGLTKAELDALPESAISQLRAKAEKRLLEAGAHYVCDGIWAVLPVLQKIDSEMKV